MDITSRVMGERVQQRGGGKSIQEGMLEPVNGGVRRHGTFREPTTQGLSRMPRGQGSVDRDHAA